MEYLEGMKTNIPRSVAAIAFCAIIGAVLAWLLIGLLNFNPVLTALLTAFTAMVFATAIFAGVVTLGRALKIIK
jgi:uncharacterized membrane protein YuzA (DUF378 family)